MHLGPHSVVMGKERVPGPWFCSYWRQRWEPRVSQAHSFLNLKHKEWKFKAWEEKKIKKQISSLNGLLLKATEISKTKKRRSLKYRENLHLSCG